MWDTKDGARLRNEDGGMVDAAPLTVASPDGKRFFSRGKIGDVGTGKKARLEWTGPFYLDLDVRGCDHFWRSPRLSHFDLGTKFDKTEKASPGRN